MNKEIEEFVNKRPDVVAAYGYGSGIFKQSGYTNKDKPQIDLILVVDDLKKWHKENIKLNKNDYSLIGKVFFKYASIKKLKGPTCITYVSNILENGNIYKYGTIEEKDLINNLKNWNSFYLPGRFQKTIYPIKESKELREELEHNRMMALLLSGYLQDKDEVTKKDLFVTLCGLSYLGDTRMKFAENPRKVLNIVEGSFDKFDNLYKFDKKYFNTEKNKVIINKSEIKKELNNLPSSLYEYIKNDLDKDDKFIKEKIYEYFTMLNKRESTKQTIKGIYTNGLCRSIKYASKKVLKKFKK